MARNDTFERTAAILNFLGLGQLPLTGSPANQMDFGKMAEMMGDDVQVDNGEISEWMWSIVSKFTPKTNVDLTTYRSDIKNQMARSAPVLQGISHFDEVKSAISNLSSELQLEAISTVEFADSLAVPLDAREIRILQVISRCFEIIKESPFVLMENARNGDRSAVLALVKIEKMFLHDSCTKTVITEATRRVDRAFLRQLGRAVCYKPRPSKKILIRCFLYFLFEFGIEIPKHTDLLGLFDHDGTIFRGVYGFDRFVRRCRIEFDGMATIPSASS